MYKHSLLLLWKSSLKGLLRRPSLLHRVATTTALSCHWGGGGVGQGWFTHHLKAEAEEEITWPEQNNDVNALRGEINIRPDWMSLKGPCGCKSQSEHSLQGMGYWYHEDHTGYSLENSSLLWRERADDWNMNDSHTLRTTTLVTQIRHYTEIWPVTMLRMGLTRAEKAGTSGWRCSHIGCQITRPPASRKVRSDSCQMQN